MRRAIFLLALLAACGDDAAHRRFDAASGSGSAVPGIYVTDLAGAILVFDPSASGDVAPVRTITGPDTALALPIGIAVDHDGNIYAANREGGAVTMYGSAAVGDAAPTLTFTATGMGSPEGLALGPDDSVYASTCPGCGQGSGGDVGVFHFPRLTMTSDFEITGADTGVTNPDSIAVGSDGTIYLANAFGGAIDTFAPGAVADAAPTSTLTPHDSLNIQGMDAAGAVIAAVSPSVGVELFGLGTNGTAPAVATIAPSTQFPLVYPAGVTVDNGVAPSPDLYVADINGKAIYILHTEGTGANLSVTSVTTIAGDLTTLTGPLFIAVVH